LVATQVFLGSVGLFSLAGTIMRVRGAVTVQLDPGAADDRMVVGVGLILASDDAIAIGATAIPSPMKDMDAEWLWHGLFPLKSLTGTQTDAEGGQCILREIDSKAMRKFKPNQQLAVMTDGIIGAGSPTGDVTGAVRVLIGT